MREVYGVDLPERPGDLETIAAPLDWLGLNYYFPTFIADDPSGPPPFTREVQRPGVRRTAMDWEISDQGLEALLMRLTDDYGAQRIHVTENGSAWPDVVGPDGQVDDPERIRYLEEHLAACVARSPRRPAGRVLRLVPAGQLRVGVRVRQALRPRLRRLRDAAADHQGQRPAVRRPHPRPPPRRRARRLIPAQVTARRSSPPGRSVPYRPR